MALIKQLVPQPFAGGVDTKTDAKLVRYPSMLQLDNATIEDVGSIQKRDGYVALGANVTGAEALFEHQGQLLCADGANLHRYADSAWREIGASSSVKVTAESIAAGGATQSAAQYAATSAFEAVIWQQSSVVYYSTRDLSSDTWSHSKSTLSSTGANALWLVAAEDVIFAVVSDAANVSHSVYRCASASGGFSLLEVLATGSVASADWVAFNFGDAGITSGDWGLLGVSHDDASTNLLFWAFKQDGTRYAVGDNFNAGTFSLGGTAGDWPPNKLHLSMPPQGGDPRVLMYGVDGNVTNCYYVEVDLSANVALASLNLDSAVGESYHASIFGFSPTGTLTGLKIVCSNTAETQTEVWSVTSEAGATTSSITYGLFPGSRSFTMGSNRYVMLKYSSTLQNGFYLFDCDEEKIVGKALYTTAGANTYDHWTQTINFTKLTTPVSTRGEEWYYQFNTSAKLAVPYKARVDTVTVGFNSTVNVRYNDATALLTFDLGHNHRYMSAELGENLHIAGGFVQAYDGQNVFEHGFFNFPEGVTATDTGGGSLAAGTYLYKVIYEWTDAKGQVHRSAASPAVSCVTGANRQNTVTYPNYRFGNRTLTDVRIGIYRTQVGGTSVFYRVTTVNASPTNDPTSSTTTYVDNNVDATIATRDTLYTVGGELDNDAPPPCQILFSAKNRLWAVDEWGKLWYSKEYRPGEAVGFSLFLSKQIPQYGGAITALGLVDDKLIVFKDEKTFALAGEGPTPDGQNDTFSLATELPAKVGCNNPLSVVEYDDGILFKSNKGIYLLDRGLNARYVGQGVHTYNDLTIVAAVALPTKNQVRFITSDGKTLVYDYEQRDGKGDGIWSTFSNLESYDAVVWQDSLRLLSTSSEVLTETAGTFTDNGEYITTTVETGWFAPVGPQGWKRLYRVLLLGEKKSEHTLNVGLAYNYQSEDIGLVQFDTTDLADTSYGEGIFGSGSYGTGTEGDLYQFRINPAKQECSAVKIRIWDSGHAGTGESFSLTDLTFEVGLKSAGGVATKLSSGRSG